MRHSLYVIIMISLILAAGFNPARGRLTGGEKAPEFELSRIGNRADIQSDKLFGNNRYTFLVFWQSGCSHCEEILVGCDRFYREYGGGDIEMTGINWGEDEVLAIRETVERNLISFPQLFDPAGGVAIQYEVPLSVVVIYLVGGDGRVVGSVVDPPADISPVLMRMMYGEEESHVAEEGGSGGDRSRRGDEMSGYETEGEDFPGQIRFAGLGRLRYLAIEADGDAAAGPYGQPVSTRNNLLHRFELEASTRLGSHLTVGGLLRISNEGLDVLRGGPDYFDSEWGSAFARVDWGRFGFRLGYYSIYMTPLTMMRWDWDDNPRTGGDAGCNCGATAGALRITSLEKLGPELRFEGARTHYTIGNHSLTLFYAIPRRARAIEMVHSSFGGEENACYSLETFGLDYRWQRYIHRLGSFIRGGIHFAGSRENPNSIDPLELGYTRPFKWYHSDILSLTAEVPLLNYRGVLGLRGEWVPYNQATRYNLGQDSDRAEEQEGNAAMAGITFRSYDRLNVMCDYIKLDEGFHSPFAAISYQPGMEGFRVSSRSRLPGERFLLSLFYKRLQEIEPESPELNRIKESLSGISLDMDLENGFGASAGYIDLGRWREEEDSFDFTRKAYTVSTRFRFTGNSYIQAEYQRVEVTDDSTGKKLESETDLYSVYLDSRF